MISKVQTVAALIVIGILIFSCIGKKADSPPMEFVYDNITPVPFPDPQIPGFTFPQDSNVINGWISAGDNEQIYRHGWGIWAGLTMPSDQSAGGNVLLTYETWLTPSEILDSINNNGVRRSNRVNMKKPNQLVHAAIKEKKDIDFQDAESVAYSPAAAKYSIENKIFLYTTLAKYAEEGRTEIPAFPSDAITIKPVFKIIRKSELNEDSIFTMASWPGPTDKIQAFPEQLWNSCIYVDINNKGQGNGSQDKGCDTRSPENTYNVTDFIHFYLNAEDIYYYNREFGLQAQIGDIAILVAMHVATRETLRWTWQTFWWAPDPDNPPAPSSKAIADARPRAHLSGAANHYAMAVAYSKVYPEQPYTGGESVGDTVIGFNPYLEAGFGPNVFTGSNSFVVKNGEKIMTNAGVRTNCMSCHIYAAYNVYNPNDGTPYSGDAYVSLSDPIFNGKLKLDFAWSIQGNVDTTGMAAFLAKHSK